jgi:hypothetical protein
MLSNDPSHPAKSKHHQTPRTSLQHQLTKSSDQSTRPFRRLISLHPSTKLILQLPKHPDVFYPILLKQKNGTNYDAAFPQISSFSTNYEDKLCTLTKLR